MIKPKFFSTAYPGSMSEREDGDYVERTDSPTLALTLLGNLFATERDAEDWKAAAIALEKELSDLREEYKSVVSCNDILADKAAKEQTK